MNFTETITATRPNTEIGWAWDVLDKTERDADYRTRYIDTGLVLSDNRETTPDGLTTTFTRTWVTKEAYDEYLSNPLTVSLLNNYHEYANNYGIVYSTTAENT